MRSIIAYVVCYDSDVIAVHIVDTILSNKGITVHHYNHEYFHINVYEGHYTQIVKAITKMLLDADMIYVDTAKSESYTTRLIALTPVITYYYRTGRQNIVELSNADRALVPVVEKTLVYRSDMDEIQFNSMLYKNLDELQRDATYQRDLIALLQKAIRSK